MDYFDDDRTFAVSNRAMKDESTAFTKPHTLKLKFGFFKEVYATKEMVPSFAFGASGGHALFDREKFIQLGGFDELFSPFYYEDADLSYRAWKRGYRVYYEPESIVYHEHQATIGNSFSKSYIDFVLKRNRLIFMWKNLSDFVFLVKHLIFLPIYLVLNALRNPIILLSFMAALVKLPLIFRARREEKKYIFHRDKDIQDIFRESDIVISRKIN